MNPSCQGLGKRRRGLKFERSPETELKTPNYRPECWLQLTLYRRGGGVKFISAHNALTVVENTLALSSNDSLLDDFIIESLNAPGHATHKCKQHCGVLSSDAPSPSAAAVVLSTVAIT